MNLRIKTLLVVGTSIFLFLGLLYKIASPFLYEDSMKLDESLMTKDLERAQNQFSLEMDILNRTNRDWAVWDDAYYFVNHQYQSFPSVNLYNDTFENNKINYMIFINNQNKLVYQKGYDLNNHQAIKFKDDFYKVFLPVIKSSKSLEKTVLVKTDYGLTMSSFQSIYKSSGEGRSVGVLIMGKMIDSSYIKALGNELSLPLSMNPIENHSVPSKLLIDSINEKEIKGSFYMQDYENNQAYAISLVNERRFYLQKVESTRHLQQYLILTAVFFIILILVLMNKFILSRINQLSFQLNKIQNKRDVKSRVRLRNGGKDELANLEQSINKVLSSLEEKHNDVIKLAYFDQDTKLPNRYWVTKEFHHFVKGYEKTAVLFFDLDGFKRVNDSLGHKIGDALIIQLCERLSPIIEELNGIFSRIGGDEFLILLDYKGKEDLEKTIQHMLNNIGSEFDLHSYKTFVTTSVGISIYPDDGIQLEQLMQNADIAMFEAKRKGNNQYQYYRNLTKKSSYRNFLELENDLKFALKKKQFQLYYQIIVNGFEKNIVGVEALLRWNHPTKGMIPPDKFIPIAEETGLMTSIGKWVLEEAVRQLKIWHDNGFKELTMAINVSKTQMRDDMFIEKLDQVLEESQIPASMLHIEITETDIHLYPEEIMRFTKELKKRNVKIALDDFGVGTSSLQYLKDLPLDIIKIDQNFIKNVPSHSFDTILLYGIFEIMKKLKLEVVVEGIEKEDQIHYVNSHIHSKLQGYYFSRPLPSSVVDRKFLNWDSWDEENTSSGNTGA